MVQLISDIGSNNPLSTRIELSLRTNVTNLLLNTVSHDFNGKDMLSTAYYCRCMLLMDEPMTILSLVGFSYGYRDRLLCMQSGDVTFLSLDNGLLPMIDAKQDISVMGEPTAGYHDRMEQLYTILSYGDIRDLRSDDKIVKDYKSYPFPSVIVSKNHIVINIISINANGDVITNLTYQEFESVRAGRSFSIWYLNNKEITKISSHFIPNKRFELIAYFNEFNYLEFSMSDRDANTNQLFDFYQYNKDAIINSTIKIEFE